MATHDLIPGFSNLQLELLKLYKGAVNILWNLFFY